MARSKSIDVRAVLRKAFPSRRLRAMARETGTVVRQRKVDPAALFWTVVLGFGSGRERPIAGLRRSYERATLARPHTQRFSGRPLAELLVTLQYHLLNHHALEQ